MHRSCPWRLAVLCLALSGPASAQVIWNVPNIVGPKAKFDRSTVPAPTDAWPRLDPGAVLCRTPEDLQRLAEFRRGAQIERPNCQLIQAPTAVSIVKRVGPGQTEVAVTAQAGVDGWTDAWLPERAPAYSGKGVQIK